MNDDATSASGGSFVPSAGAVSVCAYCGALGIFTGEGLEVREPTAVELAKLEADPDVRRVVGLVRGFHRHAAARWN